MRVDSGDRSCPCSASPGNSASSGRSNAPAGRLGERNGVNVHAPLINNMTVLPPHFDTFSMSTHLLRGSFPNPGRPFVAVSIETATGVDLKRLTAALPAGELPPAGDSRWEPYHVVSLAYCRVLQDGTIEDPVTVDFPAEAQRENAIAAFGVFADAVRGAGGLVVAHNAAVGRGVLLSHMARVRGCETAVIGAARWVCTAVTWKEAEGAMEKLRHMARALGVLQLGLGAVGVRAAAGVEARVCAESLLEMDRRGFVRCFLEPCRVPEPTPHSVGSGDDSDDASDMPSSRRPSRKATSLQAVVTRSQTRANQRGKRDRKPPSRFGF